VKCYACGKPWHMSWECPEKKKEGGGEAHIFKEQYWNVEAKATKDWKSLMMRKVILKPEKEAKDPVQKISLFRISCNTKDRV
jgi:hypothetical protein